MEQTALELISTLVTGIRNGAFPDPERATTDGASQNNRHAYLTRVKKLVVQLEIEAQDLEDYRGVYNRGTKAWEPR